MLRGTATEQGGLFRILIAPTATTPSVALQRWMGIEHRTWRPTPTNGQRVRPTGRPITIGIADFATRSNRRVIVHLPVPHQVGTILTHFPDTYQTTTPTRAHWTDSLRPLLDPSKHWRIYADGSWRARSPPQTDDYFLTGDSHGGGGALVLMATDEDWASRPIIVIPFTTEGLGPAQGGSPTLMELLAITGGIQILSCLNLQGTVLSDCQGLVRKIAQRHVLRRNPTNAGYPLLRDCARSLTHHRTLKWIKGHPERSQVPRSGWTQDQWGNFLADSFASDPHRPPPLDFPQLTTHRILSHTAIAQASVQPHDWHFIAPGHAPLLDGLRPALASASLMDYLETRDASRAARGVTARWEGTSVQLAAKAWRLAHRGIAKRGAKVRHLWDLRWHGENQAVANPHLADVLGVCPLCGHPSCSQTHILCNCPGIAAERDGLAQDLALMVHRLRPGPERSLGRAFHHLLFHHRGIDHRGHLWTGLWTPQQRAHLSPHLHRCTLKDGQRILLLLSTWAATGVSTLWSHFKEHTKDSEPMSILPTSLPDTHPAHPKPPVPDMNLSAPDTPVRPARDSPSPSPKRRRLARPPPEPPPPTPRPPSHAQAPRSPTAPPLTPPPTRSPRILRPPRFNLAVADYG